MTEALKFSGADVLRRALAMVREERVDDGCGRGAFCPWCAIGQAKCELDREHEVDGPPTHELLWSVLLDDPTPFPTDQPLIEAREALKPFAEIAVNSRAGSIRILATAIEGDS